MHYVDLALSFALFVLGALSFFLKRFKTNLWISILAIVLFPLSVYSYYFTDFDRILFGKVTIQDLITYPFVKLLLILALARAAGRRKPARAQSPQAQPSQEPPPQA
jgi:hypothetical protein